MSAGTQLELATPETARYLTDRIKVALEGTWQLIAEAYVSRAWAALGYGSWDEYCTEEFGAARLRLPREERQEVVASLRDSGLSVRAIAAATGLSRGTVGNDLSGVQNWTPAQSDEEPPGVAYEEGGHPATASAQATPPPVSSPPVITGADGRRYPASRPQSPRPSPPPPPPPVLSWDADEDDEIVEAEIVEDGEDIRALVGRSGHAQAHADAQWRKELAKSVDALNAITTFDPERAVAICDDDLLFLIDANCKAIAEWHAGISRLRTPGLRVVSGGSR